MQFFIYDDLIPIFHRCEDLMPIPYTWEDLVPIIHIVLALHTLKTIKNLKFELKF